MLNKSMKKANSTVKSAANDIRDQVEDVSGQVSRRSREILEDAQEQLNEMADLVTDEIRANPWRSGFIALGLGVVIGALLSRS